MSYLTQTKWDIWERVYVQSYQSVCFLHTQSMEVEKGAEQIIQILTPLDKSACGFNRGFPAYGIST